MKKIKLLGTLLIFSNIFFAQTPFVTTWNTANAGVSNADQITIPSTGFNMTLYWEDINDPLTNGSLPSYNGNVTVTFPQPGTYRVEISGGLTRINFNNGGDKLKLISIEQWGTAIWSTFQTAFYGCENMIYNATDAPNLSNVTVMNSAFRDCKLFDGDLSNWDVSNVQKLGATFQQCEVFNGNISNWDVSNVDFLQYTFANCFSFNQPLNNWDVSNVTNMIRTFYGCNVFNQDLDNWNTSNVNNFGDIFQNCYAFNGDITTWDVTGATSLGFIFVDCHAFNQDISTWDVSNCTNMSTMFVNCYAFNQDISNWNVSNVTNFYRMFNNASSFNQDISSWNTGNVTNTARMFWGATSFNQDLSSWDMSNVTNMERMFHLATSFNQNLGSWNVENVANFTQMFDGAGLSVCNYDALLNGWATQNLTGSMNFHAGYSKFSNIGANSRQTIIDNFGWTFTDDGMFQANYSVTEPNCFGGNDASVMINTNGYQLFNPYQVTWSGVLNNGSLNTVGTTIDVQNLQAESLNINIVDNDGCQLFNETITITEPSEITVDTINFSNISCNGLNDGFIEVQTTGGTGNLSIEWTDGMGVIGNSLDISSLNAGTYTANITDDNGCIITESYTIINPDIISINATVVGNEILTNASGGTGAYQYEWSGPNNFTSTNANIDNLEDGTFSLTLTDENGCEISESFEILFSNIISFDASKVKIYPNPGEGIIQVDGLTVKTIKIFNTLGELVDIQDDMKINNAFDVSHLKSGFYIVELLDDSLNGLFINFVKK